MYPMIIHLNVSDGFIHLSDGTDWQIPERSRSQLVNWLPVQRVKITKAGFAHRLFNHDVGTAVPAILGCIVDGVEAG